MYVKSLKYVPDEKKTIDEGQFQIYWEYFTFIFTNKHL